MERKLKCVIVDDDPGAHHTIIEQLKDSPLGEVTRSFYKPSELLANIHALEIDVVFLDVIFANDKLQGLDIAPMLTAENKIIIFISDKDEHILKACRYVDATDVIPMPNSKERLISSLIKARKIASPELNRKEHEWFFVAGRNIQVSIRLSDILYVKTAKDPRNKKVILRSGEILILMDCTFSRLLELCPKLIQINVSELVSYDVVDSVAFDTVYVKPKNPPEIPNVLVLSNRYQHEFRRNIA